MNKLLDLLFPSRVLRRRIRELELSLDLSQRRLQHKDRVIANLKAQRSGKLVDAMMRVDNPIINPHNGRVVP